MGLGDEGDASWQSKFAVAASMTRSGRNQVQRSSGTYQAGSAKRSAKQGLRSLPAWNRCGAAARVSPGQPSAAPCGGHASPASPPISSPCSQNTLMAERPKHVDSGV